MHNISWVGQWHYPAHLWPLVCVVPFICTLHDQQFLLSPLHKKEKLWIQYLSLWSIVSHFNFWTQEFKERVFNHLIIPLHLYIPNVPWGKDSIELRHNVKDGKVYNLLKSFKNTWLFNNLEIKIFDMTFYIYIYRIHKHILVLGLYFQFTAL